MNLRAKLTHYWPLFLAGKLPPTFFILHPLIFSLCEMKKAGLFFAGELDQERMRLYGVLTPHRVSPRLVSDEAESAYQETLRYRISRDIPEHPFRNYWQIFLLKHQKPINVWAHVIAMVFLYSLILMSVLTHHYWLLILIPISQLMGLVSHATVERTHIDFEDAIFSLRAFACLNRMMVLALSGRYWKELAKTQMELKEFHDASLNQKVRPPFC